MNLIPMIRESLGLEVNEEFKLIPKFLSGANCVEDKYRFTNDTFQRKNNGKWEGGLHCTLLDIILDNYEVVKLPFKPNEYETYYSVNLHFGTVEVSGFSKDFTADVIKVNSGNCYRTEEEAEKHIDEWMSRIYGENWKELLK